MDVADHELHRGEVVARHPHPRPLVVEGLRVGTRLVNASERSVSLDDVAGQGTDVGKLGRRTREAAGLPRHLGQMLRSEARDVQKAGAIAPEVPETLERPPGHLDLRRVVEIHGPIPADREDGLGAPLVAPLASRQGVEADALVIGEVALDRPLGQSLRPAKRMELGRRGDAADDRGSLARVARMLQRRPDQIVAPFPLDRGSVVPLRRAFEVRSNGLPTEL